MNHLNILAFQLASDAFGGVKIRMAKDLAVLFITIL